jgi:hypothetical protein
MPIYKVYRTDAAAYCEYQAVVVRAPNYTAARMFVLETLDEFGVRKYGGGYGFSQDNIQVDLVTPSGPTEEILAQWQGY